MNKITSMILFHIMYVVIPGIASMLVLYLLLSLEVPCIFVGIACIITLYLVGNFFDSLQIKFNKEKRKKEVIVDDVMIVSGDSSRSSILKDR